MTKSASELIAEAMQTRQDPERDDAAIPLLERAIELDPSRRDAYSELGFIYHARGAYRNELAVWLARFNLEPSDPDASEQIGWVLWFIGRARDSLPWLQRAVTLRPSSRWATFYLGNAFLWLQDYDRAREMYGRQLELHADHSSAHAGVTWALLAAGNDSEARTRLRVIRSSRLDDDRYDVKRADLEHFLGEPIEAVAVARRGLVANATHRYGPRGICASTVLGSALWDEDRPTAEEALQQSVTLDTARLDRGDEGHMPRFDLAAVHAVRGESRQACQWLEAAVAAGWWYPGLARRDPLFRNIHREERFQRLMSLAPATTRTSQ
jgi:tetratricopeptide (TPR) repeat protein